MKNIYILLAIAAFFATSCESLLIKDLELEDTGFEKQLVIQSQLQAGTDSIIALVSENTSVLENFDNIVYLDADVSLRKAGSEIAVLQQGSDGLYYYFFDEPFQDVGEYELLVENTKYGDSQTTTKVPEHAEIKDLEFRYNVGVDPLEMSQVSEVSFTIVDKAGQDYYEIDLFSKPGGLDTFIFNNGMDTIYNERRLFIYPTTTQLEPSISISNYSGKIFINGEFFDQQEYRINVRLSIFNNGGDNTEESIKELLALNFTTHSEDSYNYATSLDRYFSSQDFGLFSEPVSVYTNIDNGLGIFAGSAKKTYEFD